MPYYEFECEVCGSHTRSHRTNGHNPPRFCSATCRAKGMRGVSTKRNKYIITPTLHKKIRRLYLGNTGNGEVRDFAEKHNLPRWKVTRYAIAQGWIAKQKREPNWSAEEDAILERNAGSCPDVIQRKLKANGFRRSLGGIVIRRTRKRLLQNLSTDTARGLAACLGVDDHFVMRHIRAGNLKASRRGTKMKNDMYAIREKDIRNFIVRHVAEIDFRKIDKYWLVDLLAS